MNFKDEGKIVSYPKNKNWENIRQYYLIRMKGKRHKTLKEYFEKDNLRRKMIFEEINKLTPQWVRNEGDVSIYNIHVSNLFNEKNLDFRIAKYIMFEPIFPDTYDRTLENTIHIKIDFLDNIYIKIIYFSSRYRNHLTSGPAKLRSNEIGYRYDINATREVIEMGETDFFQRMVNREFELFNFRFATKESNRRLNKETSCFLSNRIYALYEKILECYDLLFTGNITEKNYEKSGYNQFISESLKIANIPKLYKEAKKHPSFKSPEEFESVNSDKVFKKADAKKRAEETKLKSDSFMSEYLIFLLLLQGKMLFNLETFIHDVSKEIQERNRERGRNRLVDFRIVYKKERIGIHVKRHFDGNTLIANVSNEFDFDEDDMRISYLNVITLFDEKLKWDYLTYIKKTKNKNNKNFNKNHNEKFRRIDKIVTAGVDERFLNGTKEEQIKFFNSLLED